MSESISADEYKALMAKQRRSKYGNVKTVVDDIPFDSAAEARRYGELKLLERAGNISGLVLQPSYTFTVNGVVVCKYIGDFAYLRDGRQTVEDVKSPATKTPAYRIKRALMKACFGIEITEVEA